MCGKITGAPVVVVRVAAVASLGLVVVHEQEASHGLVAEDELAKVDRALRRAAVQLVAVQDRVPLLRALLVESRLDVVMQLLEDLPHLVAEVGRARLFVRGKLARDLDGRQSEHPARRDTGRRVRHTSESHEGSCGERPVLGGVES